MKPTIIAHRGDNHQFPENSLSGIRSAFDQGCTAVEFDIQMTTDEQLIVLHDDNTLRTSGIEKSVLNAKYSELSKISVHEPERLGDTHMPTPISTLSSALSLLKSYPDTHAYIEVKEESLEKWGHDIVLKKLLLDLATYETQCTIISFDLPILDLIKAQSSLNVGWVLYHYDDASLKKAEESQPDYLIVDYELLSLDTRPWAGNWEWMVYGVETADSAFEQYANGVKYVETDYLSRLLSDERLKP